MFVFPLLYPVKVLSKGRRDYQMPSKRPFHDVVTVVILTSRMGVSEIAVIVGNVVTVIYVIIHSR